MTKNSNALIEGQQAGLLEVAAGANPYEPGTAEHADWERGRLSIVAKHLERRIFAARQVA